MDPDVHILVAGENCGSVAEEAAKVAGVASVLHADGAALGHNLAENIEGLIVDLQKEKKFNYIVAAGSANGKNILPRVAAAIDVQPLSDILKVVSGDTFVRPVYAGNALATFKTKDPVKVLTVRTTAFEPAAATGGSASVHKLEAGASKSLSDWVKDELSASDRPELASAKRVVAGGRAMGSSENFNILNEMADHLGAAVGASRAAVDAGYAVNDMQVGQTGKCVAPDLYIAVGISGAIQHLAGMKDSKTIVAINSDPDAAIFQVADYGLVADLFTAVPEFNTKLAGNKA
jgi:electron transfer flavoprotein alpha subunit